MFTMAADCSILFKSCSAASHIIFGYTSQRYPLLQQPHQLQLIAPSTEDQPGNPSGLDQKLCGEKVPKVCSVVLTSGLKLLCISGRGEQLRMCSCEKVLQNDCPCHEGAGNDARRKMLDSSDISPNPPCLSE